MRCREAELLAVWGGQRIRNGVECGGSSKGHSGNDFGGSQEVHGIRVAVVAATEVPVIRRKDGIQSALLHAILPLPLPNTRPTGVGKDDSTSIGKGFQGAISLKGSANLLTSRGDVEVGDRLQPGICSGLQ